MNKDLEEKIKEFGQAINKIVVDYCNDKRKEAKKRKIGKLKFDLKMSEVGFVPEGFEVERHEQFEGEGRQ